MLIPYHKMILLVASLLRGSFSVVGISTNLQSIVLKRPLFTAMRNPGPKYEWRRRNDSFTPHYVRRLRSRSSSSVRQLPSLTFFRSSRTFVRSVVGILPRAVSPRSSGLHPLGPSLVPSVAASFGSWGPCPLRHLLQLLRGSFAPDYGASEGSSGGIPCYRIASEQVLFGPSLAALCP